MHTQCQLSVLNKFVTLNNVHCRSFLHNCQYSPKTNLTMLFVTESSLVSVLCVLTFTSRSLAASCYWRDGTPATLNRQNYTACDNTTTSMCCLLSGGDACTTLGLCISASGSLFRSACTDPTWKSSQCISMCPGIPC